MIESGQLRTIRPHYIAEHSGGQFSLSETARAWSTLWRTLRAFGWTPEVAASPSSPPVRVSFKHGANSYLAGLTSNPLFYEMAMGWPIGWTGPAEQVTGFAAWLLLSRGQFSRLLTNFRPDGEV